MIVSLTRKHRTKMVSTLTSSSIPEFETLVHFCGRRVNIAITSPIRTKLRAPLLLEKASERTSVSSAKWPQLSIQPQI